MKRVAIAQFAALAALALPACSQQSEEPVVETNETGAASEEPAEPLNIDSPELPPMIARSASYRCTDGNALYVDILTDEDAVMVRDSRADVPLQLTRSSAGEPFTGDGRSLSGTGASVNYSSPDRPGQSCTEAPESE